MSVEYAIIIKNKTRLETLIERFNTKAQAKFYIERSGGDFNDYEKEHEIFHNSLSIVQRNLSTVLKNKIVERSFFVAIGRLTVHYLRAILAHLSSYTMDPNDAP